MNYFGNLNDEDFGKSALINHFSALKVFETYRLAGSSFAGNGTGMDLNYWITGGTNNGIATLSAGQLTFLTNTTSNGSANIRSSKIGRYIGASGNFFRGVIRFGDTGTTNNYRRFGPYDINNGFYFFLSGTTFGVGHRKETIDTHINNGSFNGLYGSSFTVDTSVHTYEIQYSNSNIYYLIDDKLVHRYNASGTPASNTLSLYISAENVNTNGSTTNVLMEARTMTLNRAGTETTKPLFYNITSTETRTLKSGAGTLHAINVNSKGSGGGSISIYDGLNVSGTPIATIDTTTVQGSFEYHLDFNTGLTYSTTATVGNITMVWE